MSPITDRLALGWRRRLPIVVQTEAAECGLACVAMLAGFFGHQIDLASLRRRFPVSLKGVTLASLTDIASRLGMSSRPLSLGLDDLGRLRVPCVLHWNFTHFVVLKRVRRRFVEVHDPAGGARRLTRAEVSRAFTGVALEVWPSPSFEPGRSSQRVRLRQLVGQVSGLAGSLVQVLLLAVSIEVFAIVSPLFLQWVVDHALVTGSREMLTTLALGFGLLVVLRQAVTCARAWVLMHLSTTVNIQWRANAFGHLLRLPMSYFEKRHLGDIVSRFRSIDVIERTFTTAFIEAIVDGLMSVAMLIVLFLYSPALTLVCGAALGLYVGCRVLWYRPLRNATEEQIVHAARQESHFLESVRGARPIKLFQRWEQRRAAWLALLVEQVNAGLRGQKLQIFYRLANGLLFGIENVVIVWLGAALVLRSEFSAGMLIAFLAYKDQFTSRVSALIDKYFEVRMLQVQGERLADVLLTEVERGGSSPAPASAGADATIRLVDVRFRYAEHEDYVLDRVSLKLESGESVAVIGPSGCGKTTLLNLMLGILTPSEGRVLIGGRDLRHTGADAVRCLVGAVTQNDMLFAGTIADNISFFDERADQARIEHCARLASIHADVVRMPMGYNTFVGFMGSSLSGGQQQRVLLARALYKRPRILILDEATSHLDVKREIVVNGAMRELNMTRVIVAHRPQTIRTADRVVLLEGGRITRDTRMSPNVSALRRTAAAHWARRIPGTALEAGGTPR